LEMKKPTSKDLRERREVIENLVKCLQQELKEINSKIKELDGGAYTKLSRRFFADTVVHHLVLADAEGISGEALREKLERQGTPIKPNAFRVFLSRARQRGDIELVNKGEAVGRWRLTAQGYQTALGTDRFK